MDVIWISLKIPLVTIAPIEDLLVFISFCLYSLLNIRVSVLSFLVLMIYSIPCHDRFSLFVYSFSDDFRVDFLILEEFSFLVLF